VGDDYTSWEGGLDEASGQVRVGISYARLCQGVRPGSLIKVADGSLTVEVEKVLSATEVLGRWAG
jgi:pyruvate kinase